MLGLLPSFRSARTLPLPASQEGEAGTSSLSVGGKDGDVAGGIDGGMNVEIAARIAGDCHGANEIGDGGAMEAHKESCFVWLGDACGFAESAGCQGGGTEACKDSVTDGECVGGGGGQESDATSRELLFECWVAARPAAAHCGKAGGRRGACTGGGGTLLSLH